MNQTHHLVFAIAYAIAAGYLFTLALGHMLSLWLTDTDISGLVIRIGVIVWIALIVLSAWVASRLFGEIPNEGEKSPDERRIKPAIMTIGFISGIVVADSLLVVITLLAEEHIQVTRTGMLIVVCLAWFGFGTMGAALLLRLARKYLRRHMPRWQ